MEEKILHRASQKNTVQQLVMTGGHVQGDDFLGAADVVSLLMDDAEAAQLEQKFRELPLQVGTTCFLHLIFHELRILPLINSLHHPGKGQAEEKDETYQNRC